MKRVALVGMVCSLGSASCGATTPGSAPGASDTAPIASAPSVDQAPSASSSAAAASAPDPSAITVTTITVPGRLVLDGDSSEWGALTILPAVRKDQPAQKPGPSHVAVALTPKSVFLVGAIAGGAKSGFSLALHFGAPGFPEVGLAQRGGGMIPIGECTEEIPGMTLPIDECKQVRATWEKFAATESARYSRVLRVDANGVTGEGEALTKAIASGTFKSKASADGFTFEAELPLAVLPRASEAPVGSIGLLASTGAVDATREEIFVWGNVEDVGFEPNAAARSAAFHFTQQPTMFRRPQVTYQPGDANKVEVLDYAGGFTLSLETTEHVLYTKLGGEGDVEFGVVDVHEPVVMATRGGKMIGFHPFHTSPKNIAPKKLAGADGWLVVAPHVYETGEVSSIGTVQRASFDAAFIDKSGNLTEVFPAGGDQNAWASVTPTIAPNLDTLTLNGKAYDLMDTTAAPKAKQHAFRWDAKVGGYAEVP